MPELVKGMLYTYIGDKGHISRDTHFRYEGRDNRLIGNFTNMAIGKAARLKYENVAPVVSNNKDASLLLYREEDTHA